MVKVGYKQNELIRIGKVRGYVTVDNLWSLYANKELGLVAIKGLVVLGYFIEKLNSNGIPYWEYVKEVKNEQNNR